MNNLSTEMPEEMEIPAIYDMRLEDATWVLTSAFIIFTMQTGELSLTFRSINHIIEIDRLQALECWSLVAFP